MSENKPKSIMENDPEMQVALELAMLNLNRTSKNLGMLETFKAYRLFDEDVPTTMPRSQIITQRVAVPSSEHVAEIIGRNGLNIKAIRDNTNASIKTPARGEDPILVISGRPEAVAAARRQVLECADQLTQIRVRVPSSVMGLIIGREGITIKRIQKLTNTRIVTPSRGKEPCFEVTGKPEDTEHAKRAIQRYLTMRTGLSINADCDFEMVDALIASRFKSRAFPPPPAQSEEGAEKFDATFFGRVGGAS